MFLYIGRGGSYQGLDLSEKKIPAFLRIQDRFLQFARKNWRGMRITSVEVPEEDRVLILKGWKAEKKLNIFFFWRGRDLFFAHKKIGDSNVEIFQSWVGKQTLLTFENEEKAVFLLFKELGFGNVKERNKVHDFKIEEYFNLFKVKVNKDLCLKNKREKTLEKMKKELIRFSELDRLDSLKEINLEDVNSVGEGRFRVFFKGIEGHFKKREYLYDRIKVWRISQKRLTERIDSLSEIRPNEVKKQINIQYKIVGPVWNIKSEKPDLEKKQNYVEFKYKGWKCFLGRTATENDQLRKKVAHKNDTWLHLENYKSGHLFVKSGNDDINLEDFQVLGSALVELSGLELEEIPLIYTRVKNLKSIKGKPGMVNYKKEKHLIIFFHPKWRQMLANVEVEDEG